METAATEAMLDNGVIDRSQPNAMRAWSRLLGVTQVQILVAVAVVGPVTDKVRAYLDDPARHNPFAMQSAID